MAKKKTSIEGGCHCGGVRYALTAAPESSMICHCQTCRRISGAPVVAWVSVDAAKFAITRGHAKDYVSSDGVRRQFCSRCGAQLTYASAEDEDYIDITTATLDDPDAFPPAHHSWLSHNIAWIKFGDKLPTYKKSRSDG